MSAMWIIVGLACAGGVWAYVSERRQWNGGICKETGLPWDYFDTDSQGGRGYRSGEHYTWVSWPGIDK